MVFSNLIFIYIFLPLNLLICALMKDTRKKNICLLIFSLIFYAWSSPKYLVLIVLMALVNHICARQIELHTGSRLAKYIFAADLTFTLGLLGYFKYFSFFCTAVNSIVNVFDVIPAVTLPVGISFYTFQLISYVADVYKKEVHADRSFLNVLLYTSLFHQCVAGPIVRYKDIAKQLRKRTVEYTMVSDGISRFCVGLAKKVILADTCDKILRTLLPSALTPASNVTVAAAWTGGLIYMLQIYLDFSAYSDMAIGLGKMSGLIYNENFNYPYAAVSITDFWRRWHISLGTFFRDYVYIPLGGNKRGIKRQIFNMLVVWGLTGLWHGAAYNFVLWGLYYFVFLVLEKTFLLRAFSRLNGSIKQIITRIYTLTVVFFGWIIFRYSDLETVSFVIKAMFGGVGNVFINFETATVILNNIVFIIICIIAATPVCRIIKDRLRSRVENGPLKYVYIYNVVETVIPAGLLFLSTIALVGSSYNPFIYFRF